jgi:hypothetical protein
LLIPRRAHVADKFTDGQVDELPRQAGGLPHVGQIPDRRADSATCLSTVLGWSDTTARTISRTTGGAFKAGRSVDAALIG